MKLSQRELSHIGAALYLCEGTKARLDNRGYTQYAIEFTNKDPRMIKLFMLFLRTIINAVEDRIKLQLFIYPDHNEMKLKTFWSNITHIPPTRFNKTIYLKQKNIRYRPNPLGTAKIRYTNKQDYLKIQAIIDQVFGGVA